MRNISFVAQGRGNEGKEILKIVEDIMVPLKNEIENDTEIREIKAENDKVDSNMVRKITRIQSISLFRRILSSAELEKCSRLLSMNS